jgi:hypothetical protein
VTLAGTGAVLFSGVVDLSLVGELAAAADRLYGWVRELAEREGSPAVERRLPERCRFVPTASSLGLAALDREVGRDVAAALLAAGPLRDGLIEAHDGPFVLDLDQAWLRRQYAPRRYPRGHAPHSWHQDGALGYDFDSPAMEQGGLLALVTCWIPLVPAGVDAPGLEVVARPLERVLAPGELADVSARAAFSDAPRWTPDMSAGDALLLASGTLHRTHVTPAMTRDRTSVELRTFPAHARPARLARDRFSAPFPAPSPRRDGVRAPGPSPAPET